MINEDQNYFNRTLKGKHNYGPDIETQRTERISSTLCTQSPKKKTRNLPSGVAKFVTEINLLLLGIYHNRLNDTRNQSFPICKRNKDI